MSMFNSYENLNPSYQPNNISRALPKVRVGFNDELPHKAYNLCGEFIGYSWNYGDTFTLNFDINPSVYVESNAIVYKESGEEPTSETVGTLGQRAYNIYDLRCWVCKTLDQTIYNWEEQKEFSFLPSGNEDDCVTLQVYKSFEGLKANVTIFNFRWEAIQSFEVVADDVISVEINKEISAKLIKGIYYCTVEVGNDENKRVYYEAPLIIK